MSPEIGAEELMRPPVDAPVSFHRVVEDVLLWPDVKGAALQGEVPPLPAEEGIEDGFHCPVRDQDDQLSHPSTPAAKSDPRSIPPFQSTSLGCSAPGMIVTDPSRSNRAARRFLSWALATTTGECDETRT